MKIMLRVYTLLLFFPMTGKLRSINLIPKTWPAMWTISPVNVVLGAPKGVVHATPVLHPVNLEPALGITQTGTPRVSFGNLEHIVTTTDI